jgi:hypothetical protein
VTVPAVSSANFPHNNFPYFTVYLPTKEVRFGESLFLFGWFLFLGEGCFDVFYFSNFSGSGRTMCATMGGMCIQCPLRIINQSVERDASSRRGETLPFTTNAANYL